MIRSFPSPEEKTDRTSEHDEPSVRVAVVTARLHVMVDVHADPRPCELHGSDEQYPPSCSLRNRHNECDDQQSRQRPPSWGHPSSLPGPEWHAMTNLGAPDPLRNLRAPGGDHHRLPPSHRSSGYSMTADRARPDRRFPVLRHLGPREPAFLDAPVIGVCALASIARRCD